MSFDTASIWIIAATVVAVFIGFTIYRVVKRDRSPTATAWQFIIMGVIWLVIGFYNSITTGTNRFEIGLFNLGLFFAFAGGLWVAVVKYRKIDRDR